MRSSRRKSSVSRTSWREFLKDLGCVFCWLNKVGFGVWCCVSKPHVVVVCDVCGASSSFREETPRLVQEACGHAQGGQHEERRQYARAGQTRAQTARAGEEG